jgi:hypothetical protein
MLCFSWRSGDEVIDGGHMIVPSIGQAIRSSTKVAVSSATDRPGKVHIDPNTWQKVKNSTNATYFVLIRGIMRGTKLLKVCSMPT